MTLGELKEDLKKYGIRSVGTLSSRKVGEEEKPPFVTTYFSSDPAPVFPFPLKDIYPLVTKTGLNTETVHKEKIKALKRALIPGWDEE